MAALALDPFQRFVRVNWPGVKVAVLRFRGEGGALDNNGHYPVVPGFPSEDIIPPEYEDDWVPYMNGTWDVSIYGPKPADYTGPNPDAHLFFRYPVGSDTIFWFVNLKYYADDEFEIGIDMSACFPVGVGSIRSDLLLLGVKMTNNAATLAPPKTVAGVIGLFDDGSVSKYEAPAISIVSANRLNGVGLIVVLG